MILNSQERILQHLHITHRAITHEICPDMASPSLKPEKRQRAGRAKQPTAALPTDCCTLFLILSVVHGWNRLVLVGDEAQEADGSRRQVEVNDRRRTAQRFLACQTEFVVIIHQIFLQANRSGQGQLLE